MSRTKKYALVFFISLFVFFIARPASAQERLCDTSFEDCRQPLWDLIDHETVGIDVAFWFMQDTSYATKLINRFNAGVPIRILVDPRANPTYAGNEAILNQLKAAGIPMRYKVGGGILHWKMMLFAGQNKVEFSGANYSPSFFVPSVPYQNYIDEAVYFTDDPAVVNSFKTKYDDNWTDTVNFANYGNITGALTRKYPTFPIDPAMNFPPSADGTEDFYNRTAQQINNERVKIDIIMYRHTNDRYTNDTVNARARGIPVRMITEQNEYRNLDRQWDAYNIDLLYNAGVQIRLRNHDGLNHEKAVLLYGQGMTIFGSSNWTGPSSNSQTEHNYFTTKPWFFNWFVTHFDRKWNSSESKPFAPLPPDAPILLSPSDGATGQPTTNMQLQWEGGPWAHKFDIYFGTTSNPPLIAADQFIGRVDNGVTERYTLTTALLPGTTYYWRIVSKTMANMTATGPVWSFTTAGTPPSPGPAPTISAVSPTSGTTAGGTGITITGSNFQSGATVSLGGSPATSVNVVNATTITAVTPAHAAGAVNVVVTNPDNQSATRTGGFTYTAPAPAPAPTISSISPTTGSTDGGTAVTVTGTGFLSGAVLEFGGVLATNVIVVNSTSITATTPPHTAGAVDVIVTNSDSQSGTLPGGFVYSLPVTAETILLQDNFNDNSLDLSKWNNQNLFSGFIDLSLPMSEKNQRIEIGPLMVNASGSHYTGIRSAASYNFSGAYCQVEVVQAAASNTSADTMLTIGKDVNSYYRIFVEGGIITGQKRMSGGAKVNLFTAAYDPINDRYWRIRHDASTGKVIFETAPDNGGSPGSWTQRFNEAWNTTAIPLSAVLFEIKGGTWQAESNAPGTVIFDNFKAAKP